MGTARSTRRGRIAASVLAATALVVTGCAGGGGTPESTATEEAAAPNEPVTLSVATSQNEETPNYYCGVELLKERLEEADIGFTVELYPASQLGPDADRFPLVQAGDIDIDLQGASALSSTFEPIGVVDATYAFDDVEHAFKWIDEGSEDLFGAFHEATGVNIVDGWFFGSRTFTTKDVEVTQPRRPRRRPDPVPELAAVPGQRRGARRDQPGLGRGRGGLLRAAAGHRRRPGEPDRRDPLASFDEVLNTAILNNHNVGIHWILVSDKTYEKMSAEQTELLEETIHEIRPENRDVRRRGHRGDPRRVPRERRDDGDREGGHRHGCLHQPVGGVLRDLLHG